MKDSDWQTTGYVEGISAAAGSEFAILPPQNATGNWVKVTQRIPVRIRFDPQDQQPLLRAGMSAAVRVHIAGNYDWPNFRADFRGIFNRHLFMALGFLY